MSPDPGLCASCRLARRVVSSRDSDFVACDRSRTDPAYPRYPVLPVLACAGYEEIAVPLCPDEPTG